MTVRQDLLTDPFETDPFEDFFALNTPGLSALDKAIAFAVAASCLCHSIVGDVNFTSRSEVEALMKGSGSGRVVR